MSLTKQNSLLLGILTLIGLLLIAIGLLISPIPQPQAYHNFADQRSYYGIVNAWNVLSNIPFALVGIWGIWILLFSKKIQFIYKQERWPWLGIVMGLILIAIGSSYYHLAPDNSRLVWDRIAIIIFSMSFVGAFITERISDQIGFWLWIALLGLGIYSAFHSLEDLRLYFGLQIFIILAALIMLLFPSPYTRNRDLVVIVVFYSLARLFEIFDQQIYFLTKQIISGHSLKHIAGAIAGFCLIYMLWQRKIKKGMQNEKAISDSVMG